jgi:hypothetical protein
MASSAGGEKGVRLGPNRPDRGETWPRALAVLALVAACSHETIDLLPPDQGEDQNGETAGENGAGPAGAGGAQSSSVSGGTQSSSDAGGSGQQDLTGGSGGSLEPDARAAGGSAAEGAVPSWGGSVQYDANGDGGFPTGGQGPVFAGLYDPCGLPSFDVPCDPDYFVCDDYVHRCVPVCVNDGNCVDAARAIPTNQPSILPLRLVCDSDGTRLGRCVECTELNKSNCLEIDDPDGGAPVSDCEPERGVCLWCFDDSNSS